MAQDTIDNMLADTTRELHEATRGESGLPAALYRIAIALIDTRHLARDALRRASGDPTIGGWAGEQAADAHRREDETLPGRRGAQDPRVPPTSDKAERARPVGAGWTRHWRPPSPLISFNATTEDTRPMDDRARALAYGAGAVMADDRARRMTERRREAGIEDFAPVRVADPTTAALEQANRERAIHDKDRAELARALDENESLRATLRAVEADRDQADRVRAMAERSLGNFGELLRVAVGADPRHENANPYDYTMSLIDNAGAMRRKVANQADTIRRTDGVLAALRVGITTALGLAVRPHDPELIRKVRELHRALGEMRPVLEHETAQLDALRTALTKSGAISPGYPATLTEMVAAVDSLRRAFDDVRAERDEARSAGRERYEQIEATWALIADRSPDGRPFFSEHDRPLQDAVAVVFGWYRSKREEWAALLAEIRSRLCRVLELEGQARDVTTSEMIDRIVSTRSMLAWRAPTRRSASRFRRGRPPRPRRTARSSMSRWNRPRSRT